VALRLSRTSSRKLFSAKLVNAPGIARALLQYYYYDGDIYYRVSTYYAYAYYGLFRRYYDRRYWQ